MDAFASPEDEAELASLLADRNSGLKPVEVVGGGSKRGVNGNVNAADVVCLAALDGVVDYDPTELVLTAKAGTPLKRITELLAESGQMLAFEPMFMGGLTGNDATTPTVGGVVSANLSGPRRISGGAARDGFLGFRAVSGRGEIFKAGGRVVKNVTGFDLPRMLAGSWGTLAVLTELSLKVVPAPRSTVTLQIADLDVARACDAMVRALAVPSSVSGAAYLPRVSAARSSLRLNESVTLFRVEGTDTSVVDGTRRLEQELATFGELAPVDQQAGNQAWLEVGGVNALLPGHGPVWRLTAMPADVIDVLTDIPADDWFLDWGGRQLWLRSGARPTQPARSNLQCWRPIPDVDLQQPEAQPSNELEVMRRLKANFDPNNILNPGRLFPLAESG